MYSVGVLADELLNPDAVSVFNSMSVAGAVVCVRISGNSEF